MQGSRVIVIGASAGGVEALKALVRGLPANFPAPVLIVLHVSPHGTSVLPQILTRVGLLPAFHPYDGQDLQAGKIYVAPPNHHLLVTPSHVRLTHGPRENGHRPSADPLFRSAALAYGRRVIGVILSGMQDDGTAGLIVVKQQGGISVVQDPEDALYEGMPRSAIENDHVDHIVPVDQMPALLTELASAPLEDGEDLPASHRLQQETAIADLSMGAIETPNHPGTPSVYVCPECGGTLWEIQEADLTRFRCRVGHAYTAKTLLEHQSEALEDAFWAALRALEESVSLAERLAERARTQKQTISAQHFQEKADEGRLRARLIRDVLERGIEAAAEGGEG